MQDTSGRHLEHAVHSARISVAPMMGYTDRHARYLHRLIAPRCLLYTEMLTASALTHGHADRLLQYHPAEHPVALQLGGSDPREMAMAARMGALAGFDEININVGCPSDRVQSGTFGACLMAEPERVAEIFVAMQDTVDVPVTVKHRIGIDDRDSYDDLRQFIDAVAMAGCKTFIVHARKAWLKGLSPKQNRELPPLDYQRVYRLKQDYSGLRIIINGGIKTVAEALNHLAHVDAVMIGRQVFSEPWLLAELEESLYPHESKQLTRSEVQQSYAHYMRRELQNGASVHALTKPLAGLFHGLYGAREWRRMLAEIAQQRKDAQYALPDMVAGYTGGCDGISQSSPV